MSKVDFISNIKKFLQVHQLTLTKEEFEKIYSLMNIRQEYNIELERYEILGDSLLNFFTINFIFKTFPNASEGIISKLKAILVSTFSFSILSRALKFDSLFDIISENILADMLEVFFGYLFFIKNNDISIMQNLDSFYCDLLKTNINLILSDEKCLDYKSFLQSFSQKHLKLLPKYTLIQTKTTITKKSFYITGTMGYIDVIGKGNTIKEAEQNAAKKILLYLGIDIRKTFLI